MGQGAGEVKMSDSIRNFKDLKVWQDGISLAKDVYLLCSRLPKEEMYGLSSQMKRACVSIPSNIAEGHSRNHRAEYRQFVFVAIGSLAELETQIFLGEELNFFKSNEIQPLSEKVSKLRAMLITLGRKL